MRKIAALFAMAFILSLSVAALTVFAQDEDPLARWQNIQQEMNEQRARGELKPYVPSPEEVAGWPKTVEEAVDRVVSELSEEDKALVRETAQEDLIRFHHSWGMGIRNDFGLWKGNDDLFLSACGDEPCHPDDASMNIIEAVWSALQDTPEAE